jgi:hypothetical protein
MKLPLPRGFAATSPSAAVCDHIANFSAKPGRIAPPQPPSLADFYGLRVRPYVRANATRERIDARATWTVDRPEPRKITMSFSPPRFKKTRNGPREVKWMLILETVSVTVALPCGSYTLTATNRGNSVLNSRTDTRHPICEIRRDLSRVMDPPQVEAACAELASVMPGPRPEPARKVREVPAPEREAAREMRDRRLADDVALAKARSARKLNPPAKDEEPDFAAMSPEDFEKYNAEQCRLSAIRLAQIVGTANL